MPGISMVPLRHPLTLALVAVGLACCGDGASVNGDRDALAGDVSQPESSAEDAASSPMDASADADLPSGEASGGDNDAGEGGRDATPPKDASGDADAAGAEGGLDLGKLHAACTNGTCPPGLTPVSYYGVAGPGGPQFCSCEIPCAGDSSACPPQTTCTTIADGPGSVCSAN